MTENQTNITELTAEEQAYFESGGETELKLTPEPVEELPQDAEQPALQEEPQTQERDEKGRYVPHQALHAEREEHKKTKAQLEEISRKQAVLEDRWNTLLKIKEAQPQPEPELPPDPEQDIFGFAKWQADRVKALEEKLSSQEKQTEQQRQIEAQEQEVWSTWKHDANSYASEKPEFGDAVQWLSDFRAKQLASMAAIDERFSSPEGINAQINAELRAIVLAAKEKGQRPASVVHQMALAYGFQPKSSDPQNLSLPEQLAKVASAQEAARTVGQAAGRAGADALTPEAIAAMPAAEFERWVSDPANARLLDRMMGA